MAVSDARKLHNCSGDPLASIYYTVFFPSTKLLATGLPTILHFTGLSNKTALCYFADVSNQNTWAASQARQLQAQHCWSLTELFAPDGQFMRGYFKFRHTVPQCPRSVTNFKGWCPASWSFEQYAHLCIQKVNSAIICQAGMEQSCSKLFNPITGKSKVKRGKFQMSLLINEEKHQNPC